MLHAALLLLMLEAVATDLVFTISLKRSTQNIQLSTSCRPITPSIGLSRPLDNAGCETLKDGEQLIFTRSFEGYIGEKGYVEILQKFAHIFGLHYVRERNAWCRIDERGDIEDLVRVVSIPGKGPWNSGRYVTISRRLLDEYTHLTKTACVRLFDVTRVNHDDFHGWTDSRETTLITKGDFHANLTIDPGIGSYLRGFQIVRSSATDKMVITRAWGDEGDKQYATFIAQDWKNNLIKEISCDPKHLANYFTKSDLPFEVTPAFFNAEVLRKYKADSEKYKLEDRSISCRSAWHLKTYDINEAGQVHTYLIYLSHLPYEEQLYWKSFNEPPRSPISNRAYTTDFKGEFSTEADALSILKQTISELHRKDVVWWQLRAEDLLDKIHAPFSPAADEWGNDLLALDQLLIEGFAEKWLREKAQALGRAPKQQYRSLKLVEECLVGLDFEEQHAVTIVEPLRELHDMRTKLRGHVSNDSGRALKSKALSEHGSYRDHFLALCARCNASFEQITEAFKDT
jgi:hypothetical protein